MQEQLQVFCKKGTSMRRAIIDDLEKRGHDLVALDKKKDYDRSPGWAKAHSPVANGAINFEWDARMNMLIVRAISRGSGNTPHKILGHFVSYLLERHASRIRSINIQLS